MFDGWDNALLTKKGSSLDNTQCCKIPPKNYNLCVEVAQIASKAKIFFLNILKGASALKIPAEQRKKGWF